MSHNPNCLMCGWFVKKYVDDYTLYNEPERVHAGTCSLEPVWVQIGNGSEHYCSRRARNRQDHDDHG